MNIGKKLITIGAILAISANSLMGSPVKINQDVDTLMSNLHNKDYIIKKSVSAVKGVKNKHDSLLVLKQLLKQTVYNTLEMQQILNHKPTMEDTKEAKEDLYNKTLLLIKLLNQIESKLNNPKVSNAINKYFHKYQIKETLEKYHNIMNKLVDNEELTNTQIQYNMAY